jgi:hypothetical protein
VVMGAKACASLPQNGEFDIVSLKHAICVGSGPIDTQPRNWIQRPRARGQVPCSASHRSARCSIPVASPASACSAHARGVHLHAPSAGEGPPSPVTSTRRRAPDLSRCYHLLNFLLHPAQQPVINTSDPIARSSFLTSRPEPHPSLHFNFQLSTLAAIPYYRHSPRASATCGLLQPSRNSLPS